MIKYTNEKICDGRYLISCNLNSRRVRVVRQLRQDGSKYWTARFIVATDYHLYPKESHLMRMAIQRAKAMLRGEVFND